MRPALLILAAAALLACRDDPAERQRRVNDTFLDGVYRPPKPVDSPVQVFYGEKPQRPYHEIALLQVRASSSDKLVRALKEQTRKKGGDACIVRDAKGSYQKGEFSWNSGEGGDTTEAVVIIWE